MAPASGSAARPATGARSSPRARLGWILVVFVLAVLLLGLLDRVLTGDAPTAHRRSSFSARADGFLGLSRVLERLEFTVARSRVSYGALPMPETSVLLAVDPLPAAALARVDGHRFDRVQERSLRDWVEAGGSLVLALPGSNLTSVMGMEHEPLPMRTPHAAGRELLEALLEGVPAPARRWQPLAAAVTGQGALQGFSGTWRPLTTSGAALLAAFLQPDTSRPPLFPAPAQPAAIEVFADPEPEGWAVAARLLGQPILLTRAAGDGRIWLLSSSLPLSNLALVAAGTAPFVAAMLDRAAAGGRRTVWFDEYCHGILERQGLLHGITSTGLRHAVMATILLAAVLGWRGAVRRRAPRPDRVLPRRAKEEFVIGLADLLARAGRHRAAARWILAGCRAGVADPALDALEPLIPRGGRFGDHELVRFTQAARAARTAALATRHARATPAGARPPANTKDEDA